MRIEKFLYLLADLLASFFRAPRHQKVAGENLHRLVVLIVRGVAHPDHATVWPRFRRPHFEHFAHHVQFIAGADRARPAQFVETNAENAAGRFEFAFDNKPHAHRRGMPAARRQPGEGRLPRSALVEMERLRVVFPGKSENLVFVDALAAALENLSDREIFKIALCHANSSRCRRTRSGLSNHDPPATAAALMRPKAQSATAKAANTPVRLPLRRRAK